MSVAVRRWKTKSGKDECAWVVRYVDKEGKRTLRTFPSEQPAREFHRALLEHDDFDPELEIISRISRLSDEARNRVVDYVERRWRAKC